MNKNQWKDAVTLIAGGWLTCSPWLLGHAEQATAMFYNAVAAGLVTVLMSVVGLFWAQERSEPTMVKLAAGLWTVASPWLLAFAAQRDMMLGSLVVGVVVAAVSLWQLADRYDMRNRSLQ